MDRALSSSMEGQEPAIKISGKVDLHSYTLPNIFYHSLYTIEITANRSKKGEGTAT